MKSDAAAWYRVENVDEVTSPGVLVFSERAEANVRRMIAMAGSPQRLRPHVKTHKLPQLVQLQRRLGIENFKAATIAEAEMTAGAGARHVLLAYQPVGPNVRRLLELIAYFPETRFAAIVDNAGTARVIADAARARMMSVELLVDLDCGMQRTGIAPQAAAELYRVISNLPGVVAAGLHAYDGHIHDTDIAARTARVKAAMEPVQRLRAELTAQGMTVPRLVVGGTPTFPMHARTPDVECSPGTCVLWDGWSADALPDLAFQSAAVVLTRVVSKPAANRLCLDLGHKAIASEMQPPRVTFPAVPDAVAVMHNEEHLVIETADADRFPIGTVLYGIPWHVCPTMALHGSVTVVTGGRATEQWRVLARERALRI